MAIFNSYVKLPEGISGDKNAAGFPHVSRRLFGEEFEDHPHAPGRAGTHTSGRS